MKKKTTTLAALMIAVAVPTAVDAQAPCTLKTHRQIAAGEGGFAGPLRDGDYFGNGIALLGDLDGDGVSDLAVGASGDDDGGDLRGAVWVLFMNPDGTVKNQQKISTVEGGFTGSLDDDDRFGLSLAPLGDLDGDGAVDLVASAFRDDDGGLDRGAVWVLLLHPDGTIKGQQKISAEHGGFAGALRDRDLFGRDAADLGDLDRDGITDIAVGAPGDDDGGTDRGAVWLLFLADDGTVKSHRKISDAEGGFAGGLADRDMFGTWVSRLPDLDGDGVDDLAVGCAQEPSHGTGAVWILFLRPDGTVKSSQKIGESQGGFTGHLDSLDYFGHVAALGDVDGDGIGDLAVGAPGDDDGGENHGAVWILMLDRDGAVIRHEKITETGGGFGGDLDDLALFGAAVASIGDWDHDGIGDLGVGSPGADGERGAAWMLFPNGPGGTYHEIFLLPGDVVFADEVLSRELPEDPRDWPSSTYRQTDRALGIPDGTPTTLRGFCSLGNGGSLAVRFTDSALTGSGDDAPDLWYFEVGGNAADHEPEIADVEISQDGETWIAVGPQVWSSVLRENGKIWRISIDIDPALEREGYDRYERFEYVRFADVYDQYFWRGGTAGADIDAVAVLAAQPCRGDVTVDRTVDRLDVDTIIERWGTADCRADLDGDGTTSFTDLILVLRAWGACP